MYKGSPGSIEADCSSATSQLPASAPAGPPSLPCPGPPSLPWPGPPSLGGGPLLEPPPHAKSTTTNNAVADHSRVITDLRGSLSCEPRATRAQPYRLPTQSGGEVGGSVGPWGQRFACTAPEAQAMHQAGPLFDVGRDGAQLALASCVSEDSFFGRK